MGDNFKGLLIFTIGAAVGSIATYKLVKTKAEEIANAKSDSEIEEIREYYDNLVKQLKKSEEESDDSNETVSAETVKVTNKPNLSEYTSKLEESGYVDYSTTKKDYKVEEDKDIPEPYIIDPEEYGDMEGYDFDELTLWADGVLTDNFDEPVDINSTIGEDALNHFGEDEDDVIHVRNDARQMDYEVLRVLEKYSDIKQEE